MLGIKEAREGFENFLTHTSDFQSFGRYLETVPIYPVFLGVHCILVALALRSRESESQDFAKCRPLSSWFVCIVSCYGGTIIQNFLLSQPILAALKNEKTMFLGSIAWYMVFFSPADFFWRACQLKLIKVVLVIFKEVHRLRMITNGVSLATKLHPESWAIIVIIGAVRGSGAKFIMKPVYSFVKGNTIMCSELLTPHFSTRSSVIISALLLNQKAGYFDVPFTREAMLVIIFLYMAVFQSAFVLLDSAKDPYHIVQEPICYLLFTLPAEFLSEFKKKSKTE